MSTPAVAVDLPSFDEFFQGVSECRLDMTRYGRLLEPHRDGVLISLPTSGAVRGFLVEAFYLAPGEADGPDQYGLVFNGPLDAVSKAFPEFAGRHTVNGHLRKLASLAEATGDRRAGRKTLLICIAGTAI
jgi:hypothetical protein